MPEQEVEAGEMDKAEEILDVVLPSGNEAAEVVHPGEEPFHLPAPAIAAQLPSVLAFASALPVRRDQFDVVFCCEFVVQHVGIVGFVADEAGRHFVEEASGENLFHKLALGWRSALDRYGERKTVSSGDRDDLRPLAAAGRTNGKPPFFALANVASTKVSCRLSLPCSCRYLASKRSAFSSLPLCTHC